MREDGHGVSNAHAGLLLKIVKAEDTATPFGPAPGPGGEDAGRARQRPPGVISRQGSDQGRLRNVPDVRSGRR